MEFINIIEVNSDGVVDNVTTFVTTGSDGIEREAERGAVESALRLMLGSDEYFTLIENDIDGYNERVKELMSEVEDGYIDCGNDGSVQIVWS